MVSGSKDGLPGQRGQGRAGTLRSRGWVSFGACPSDMEPRSGASRLAAGHPKGLALRAASSGIEWAAPMKRHLTRERKQESGCDAGKPEMWSVAASGAIGQPPRCDAETLLANTPFRGLLAIDQRL